MDYTCTTLGLQDPTKGQALYRYTRYDTMEKIHKKIN